MGSQPTTDDEDNTLVALAQNGDRDAYDQLMLRHQPGIATLMTRFSHDPGVVEELTQTVFVNAYLSLKNYRPQAPFAHWLRVLASRAGYDHWRREYRASASQPFDENLHAGVAVSSGPGLVAAGREGCQEALKRVMARLNPEERQVLFLIYVDGMSVAEAAAVMGWNSAMTKMRSYRARLKLRKLLKNTDEILFAP